MTEEAMGIMEAREFESAMIESNRLNSFSVGEPYYGMIDPKLSKLLESYPELYGYKYELSHLHRTAYYDWTEAKKAEIEFDSMITEDLAWFSHRIDVKRVLRHIQRAVHQIIWGDAYNGRRQKYLGTQRKSFTFSEGKNEKKGWRFWK